MLDKSQYTVRLYTTDGGVKLLRRKDGAVERQHRLNVGRLPVAYTSEPDGNLLYVMDGAVTAFQKDPSERGAARAGVLRAGVCRPAMPPAAGPPPPAPRPAAGCTWCARLWWCAPMPLPCQLASASSGMPAPVYHTSSRPAAPLDADPCRPPPLTRAPRPRPPPAAGDKVPVPPCIRAGDSGSTEVVVELEDRQPHTAVAKITSDAVRVHLTGGAGGESAQQELLQLLGRVLNLRASQLLVMRGAHGKQRIVTVEQLTPRQVYRALRGEGRRGEEGPGGRGGGRGGPGGGRGRGRRPWFAGL